MGGVGRRAHAGASLDRGVETAPLEQVAQERIERAVVDVGRVEWIERVVERAFLAAERATMGMRSVVGVVVVPQRADGHHGRWLERALLVDAVEVAQVRLEEVGTLGSRREPHELGAHARPAAQELPLAPAARQIGFAAAARTNEGWGGFLGEGRGTAAMERSPVWAPTTASTGFKFAFCQGCKAVVCLKMEAPACFCGCEWAKESRWDQAAAPHPVLYISEQMHSPGGRQASPTKDCGS